ncbi:MAG: hypothetical protein JWO54_151 [Candidatus Saccharibacteria bacterium]|nr:hypothetical protein [Candidatus Saccharibacteria bacterium]MDB5180393.1 hypothetical protein [Candidatus Saccharibacteria bacterium]
MNSNETPRPLDVVAKDAQRLAVEHQSLSELQDTAKKNMFNASTREDRFATGNVYENVVKLGREQATAARKFSADNLPELKELAEREAVAAGKSIVHFEEEPLFIEDVEEYHRVLDEAEKSEKFLQGQPDYNFAANRVQLGLLDTYTKERGISLADLRPQDMEIIAESIEWQDAARQGARMFNDLVVDKKYDERREHEKGKRAVKAFVVEREDMNTRFQAVEDAFSRGENVSR